MTAESRALHPDWHHRRIAWRIEESDRPVVIGLSGNGPVERQRAIIADPKVRILYSHRHSSILPIYVGGGTMKPGFSNW